MPRSVLAFGLILALLSGGCRPNYDDDTPLVLSVIATNDVHGELLPTDGNYGLALLGGYVDNLRIARDQDGGGVLLIDAGDMWQGTMESNVTEGAAVVAAYNAAGYDAVAVGNHEFDFGPLGEKATPLDDDDDPQGALKVRATEADFPFLAANLVDVNTGRPVAWENVQPSAMLEVAGVKVGVIGLMTERALATTIASNTAGLRVSPLALAITREADALRRDGAELIIVTAHAGSTCTNFDDPLDLSSCNLAGEIMQVALALPHGHVDLIIGGHVHEGIAHEVNGIAITSSFSSTRAFGRVDFTLNRADHTLLSRQIHAPQAICGFVDNVTGRCTPADDADGPASVASYSGRPVTPNAAIVAIAEEASTAANAVKFASLGVHLETPITREGRQNSAIGHMFTDILHEALGGDLVLHNVVGGIRGDLPQGSLIYGDVYEMYPFDNMVVQLDLNGAELRSVLARQFAIGRHVGLTGIRVFASCGEDGIAVQMLRPDDTEIQDEDFVAVMTTDFLAMGGDDVLTAIMPEEGFQSTVVAPLAREVIADWLRERGGNLDAAMFSDADDPKWNTDPSCRGQ